MIALMRSREQIDAKETTLSRKANSIFQVVIQKILKVNTRKQDKRCYAHSSPILRFLSSSFPRIGELPRSSPKRVSLPKERLISYSLSWCLLREGYTCSHPEHRSQASSCLWYCRLNGGRVGKRQDRGDEIPPTRKDLSARVAQLDRAAAF
jgi:hypothetical protein